MMGAVASSFSSKRQKFGQIIFYSGKHRETNRSNLMTCYFATYDFVLLKNVMTILSPAAK